jgi:hypothetical protein
VLVTCGAFNIPLSFNSGLVTKVLLSYTNWTGANNGYGFFSPGIPSQIIAKITSFNRSGEKSVEQLGTGKEEIDLRISTMLFLLDKVDVPNLTSRALAAYTFGHDPEVKQVNVTFSRYIVPSMKDYRQGKQPYLDDFYTSDYALKADLKG